MQKLTTIEQSTRGVKRAERVAGGEQWRVSYALDEPAWDAFLESTPGGHHVQTSLWAQVKATLGWEPVRLLVTRDEQIVAGAQILLRRLPLVGTIGFISKGPVVGPADPALAEFVVQAVQRVARDRGIRHLTVQPADNGQELAQRLCSAGFQPGSTSVAPTATLLLDVTKDEDVLLAEMSTKTRYNVRLAARKGIRVREGDAQDLHRYYQILTATGQRQGFSPYPERYFTEMWRVLHPHGYINLLLAEYAGDVVSAQLVIAFRDTVINKLSVWSGQHGNRRPNEALQWASIQWAKARGYRYYDFEGINRTAAEALVQNEPLPDALKQSVTSFKLGFGGEAALFPTAYDYVPNPLLRWAYTEIFPAIRNQRQVKRFVKRLRTRA